MTRVVSRAWAAVIPWGNVQLSSSRAMSVYPLKVDSVFDFHMSKPQPLRIGNHLLIEAAEQVSDNPRTDHRIGAFTAAFRAIDGSRPQAVGHILLGGAQISD